MAAGKTQTIHQVAYLGGGGQNWFLCVAAEMYESSICPLHLYLFISATFV
jgi:hypothetical protein